MENETYNKSIYGVFSDQLIDNVIMSFAKNFSEGHAYGEGLELIKNSDDEQIKTLVNNYLEILQDELQPFLIESLIKARETLRERGNDK